MHGKGRLRIGYHMSVAGKMEFAFDRADELGCSTMQIFLTNPRTWLTRKLNSEEIESFKKRRNASDVNPVVAHMPYLPNLSSSEKEIKKKSIESLKVNISLAEQLGIDYLVLHLGSHMGHGIEKGRENLAEAIKDTLDLTKGCTMLLENSAGQKNSIGSKMDELTAIYDAIGSKRIGFCLDTCHVYAAGYDITKEEVLDQMDKEFSFDLIKAIHLNDAKHELGSGLDRHENIGFGHINKGFRTFLLHDRIREKPMILETPYNPKLKPGEEIDIVKKMLG